MSGNTQINFISVDSLLKIYIDYLNKLANNSIPKDTIIGLNIINNVNTLDITIYGTHTFGILVIDNDKNILEFNEFKCDKLYCIVSKEYDTIAACRLFAKGEYGIIYVFFTNKTIAENYAQDIDKFTVMECNVTRKL